MNKGYSIANEFYQAFSKSDAAGMNVHYAEEATFSDPIFAEISEFELRGMLEMLCIRAKYFRLSYQTIFYFFVGPLRHSGLPDLS
jgi:hypothetical protein